MTLDDLCRSCEGYGMAPTPSTDEEWDHYEATRTRLLRAWYRSALAHRRLQITPTATTQDRARAAQQMAQCWTTYLEHGTTHLLAPCAACTHTPGRPGPHPAGTCPTCHGWGQIPGLDTRQLLAHHDVYTDAITELCEAREMALTLTAYDVINRIIGRMEEEQLGLGQAPHSPMEPCPDCHGQTDLAHTTAQLAPALAT